MSRPKSRQVGTAGLVTRYRNGACTHTCRRCPYYAQVSGWRAAVRAARRHDAAHQANAARYGRCSREERDQAQRREAWRRRPFGRLAAAVVVVLALAVLAFGLTVANVSGHAAPAPAPAAPSIAVVPTTTVPVGPGEYVPTPAGPPATDADPRAQPGPGADQLERGRWVVSLFRREFRVGSVLAVRGPRRASAARCFNCPWSGAGRRWRSAKAIACYHAAHCPARGGGR